MCLGRGGIKEHIQKKYFELKKIHSMSEEFFM